MNTYLIAACIAVVVAPIWCGIWLLRRARVRRLDAAMHARFERETRAYAPMEKKVHPGNRITPAPRHRHEKQEPPDRLPPSPAPSPQPDAWNAWPIAHHAPASYAGTPSFASGGGGDYGGGGASGSWDSGSPCSDSGSSDSGSSSSCSSSD